MTTALATRGVDLRKVDAWIAAQRQIGAAEWQLLQVRRGGGGSVVNTYKGDAATKPDIAAEIVGFAQGDADDTAPGLTSAYAIVAYASGGDMLARYSLRLTGRVRDAGDIGPEEDPTPQGALAQYMRHEEARMRLRAGVAIDVADGYRTLIGSLEKELERKDARIKSLEEKLDGVTALRGELAENKAKHEREARESQWRHERIGKALALGFAMLPVLLKKRMGEDVDPEVMAFIASLEPEQLPRLAAALTQPQQLQLVALFKKYVPESPPADAPKPN